MKKYKMLFAGESWLTHNMEVKGWDDFSVGGYGTEIDRIHAAMDEFAEITHLPSHLVGEKFPSTMEELKTYDVVILSDVGANTLLLHPLVFTQSVRFPNRLQLLADYVEQGGALGMMGGYMTFQGIGGILMLLGVYCGSIYGGSITAILINTPGTPASAATSLDGYPMAQKGHGLRALHDALSASTIGGLFSCAVLLFAAPPIASFALKFGPAEYFALALFGLTIIASVGGKSQIKGLLMGFVGLLISCIGIDPMDGVSRFTFGINRMEGGIDTIPVLIGLFAITEIMAKARDMNKATGTAVKVEKEKTRFRDVLKYKMVLLKSSILGVFIGAVPGTGAAISSFLAYNEAKRTSKHPEEYGHGSEEAVVASESANNAVTGATLIPLLTLGIPGDTNTAVLLGALTMQGIAAGPQLFTQHGEWVYTIMLGLIAVNIFMYLQGRVFIRGFVNITRVPTSTLVPILVMLCVIGAYAIDYSVFNAIFMVGVGIFGYFMTKLDMPMTPMVIGLVLGKLCESNLRRALIVSKGSWATFFTSPISLFFILLSLFMLFFPYIKKKLAARRAAA